MRNTIFCIVYTLLSTVLLIGASRYVVDIPLISLIYSLHLHIGIACLVVTGCMLLIKRSAYGFFLLLATLAFTGHAVMMTREFTTPNPDAVALDGKPSYRIMSFNVLTENTGNGERIANLVVNSGADLVSLMEAMPIQPHLDRVSETYPYRLGCGVGTEYCDLLLLSKTPFLAQNLTDLSELRSNRLAVTDVKLGETVVHVIAAHFSKPYFDHYHAAELRRMVNLIRSLKGPVILAGDFNAASIAPDMRDFLMRTGMKKANHEPATWPTETRLPGVAIDHIYARAPLTLTSIRRIEDNMGSNHYGLVADFIIYGQK